MTDSYSKVKNTLFSLYDVPHNNNTIIPLEGLRAIAAFMVFVVHYSAQISPWISNHSLTWELIPYFRYIGSKGVELFFVISGFLIYGMLLNKNTPFIKFINRRIRRLYPTFLVMLLIYLVLSFVFPQESKLPSSMVDSLIYILANILMLPGIVPIEPIISVSWSLSYEMFFYISAPLVFIVLNIREWSKAKRLTLIILVSLLGFLLIHSGFVRYHKMIFFLAGALLYETYSSKNPITLLSRPFILPLLLIVMVALKYFSSGLTILLVSLYIGFFILCYTCFNQSTKISQICCSKFLRSYGNMSYSYYLIHGITLKFFFFVLGYLIPANHQWDLWFYGLMGPVFILTFIASTLLFVIVEKPLSLVRKGMSKPVKAEC